MIDSAKKFLNRIIDDCPNETPWPIGHPHENLLLVVVSKGSYNKSFIPMICM